MSRRPDLSRRDFLTGAFRRPNRPLAAIGRDFSGPESAPDVPEWGDQALEQVIASLNDLTGIEEP